MLRTGTLIRLATHLEVTGQHDLADRLRRLASQHLAMRPFNPETDVRDPEAYDRIREMTGDPNPIRHIQPAYRGSVPLVVTPHTQLRGVGNARGWAKTVGPEHRDYLDQSEELSDLIYRSTQGVEPGQLMSSQRTGGGTPVHERAHIDLGDRFLSHHDTKKRLGVEDSDNWLYWSLAPGEIAAQIQQIAAVVRNVGFHTKTDRLGVTDDIINKPERWSGNDFKYIRLKSGVRDDDVFGAVMNAVARIGWGPILRAAEIVARGPREYQKDMHAYPEIREARERQRQEYEKAVKTIEFIIASVQTTKARRGLPEEVTPEELPDITPENERWRMQEVSDRMIWKREQEQTKLQQANDEGKEVQREFREQIYVLDPDDPNSLPSLALSQATGREADRIWGEYTGEVNRLLAAGRLTEEAQRRTEMARIDQLYGLHHFASQMAFALDVGRVEGVIGAMIERGGLRQLPGEDLEHELSPEAVARARGYATAKERTETDDIVGVVQPGRYENALVATKLGVPLSVIQNLLFIEDRVENIGMENAIGELQDEIMGYAPSEDLIISALPFLVGEPGKSQRQHWLTNNPEIIARWREDLPNQPVIGGSQVSHDRVRDAWDRAMAEHRTAGIGPRWIRLAAPIMDLYHGTPNRNLRPEDLEPRMPDYEGSLGEGVYFGTQRETAEGYATNQWDGEGNVIHRRLDIRNPLVIDGAEGINYRIAPEFQDAVDQDRFDSILLGERIPPFDVLIGGQWCEVRDGMDLENIGIWARRAGHDAIIARNIRWDTGGRPNEEVLVLPTHPEFADRWASSLDRRGQYDIADRMERLAAKDGRFVRLAQRQYMLPLEVRPEVKDSDYSNEARDIIPEDEIPEWMYSDQRGLYHVTTDLPAVLQNGLQSRRQLQRRQLNQRGLGGEMPGENLEMVATTYSQDRAQMIEEDLRRNVGWIRGDIPSEQALRIWIDRVSQALDDAGWDYNEEDDDPDGLYARWNETVRYLISVAENNGIPAQDLLRPILDDKPGAVENLGRRMDNANLSPEAKFEMMQNLEQDITSLDRNEYDPEPMSSSGLAADLNQYLRIDPSRIGTVPLRARKDALREHYPIEEQVNFFPSDLQIIHRDLLPHEGRAIQETMLDPQRHRIRMNHYAAALQDAFEAKSDEREWISRIETEPVPFGPADVLGVIVRYPGDIPTVQGMLRRHGLTVPVSAG